MAKRGKSIGHYLLGDTIGEGTFGKVKLGTHVITGENVAVKILEKERIVDVADVERVAREIHILKLIRHPHIVQLYEIIETPRQLYLIMDYANGGELFDYIVANVRVKEREACKFFHQIVSGVDAIHDSGVVHRDLKPENLLLDEDKNIKIVDFGLSNTFTKGQLLKTACGSPCYAAPEMIAGQQYVPSLCDIWSCGVILFAIICGFLPFEDQNTSNLYNKILRAEYQLPRFVSKAAKEIISGMLTTDPTARLDFDAVRRTSWYLGLIDTHDLTLRPPDLQFVDTTVGCGNPMCTRCNEWFSHGSRHIDDEILSELEKYNFPKEYALNCLKMNKHNHATTTYYLLLEKKTRFEAEYGGDSQEKFANFDRPDVIEDVDVGVPIIPHGEAPPLRLDPMSNPPPPVQPLDFDAGGYLPEPHSQQQPRQPRQPQSARQPRETDRTVSHRVQSPSRGRVTPTRGQRELTTTASGRVTPIQTGCATPRGPANAVVERLYGRNNFTPRAPAPTTPRAPGVKYDKSVERPSSGHHSARQYSVGRPSSGATPSRPSQPSRPAGTPNSTRRPQQQGRNIVVAEQEPARPRERAAPLTARGATSSQPNTGPTCLSAREPREIQTAMRSCRGAFNVSCTTTKAPKITMQEIQRSLNLQRVSFKQNSAFSVRCQKQTIKFEVEVSHLDNLESVYVIRFKRIAGELAQYKDLCSRLLGDMRV